MPITQELLNQTDALARQAGDAIMEIYGRDFAVEHKEDNSPLTEADAAAHQIIVNGLNTLPLTAPILSEEDTAGFAGADDQGRYWLVDPLDGTKEFIKRNGEFTVNIALIEQGEPVLGVVYAPALGLGYMAAKGLGAFKTEGNGEPEAIRVVEHKEGQPWRVVGSRSHAGGELPALLAKLGEHELVAMGSSLKLCLVAEGKADVYPRLGPTSLWDTGAAQCVVEQAGGRVLQLNGEPLGYANTREVLNPYFLALGENGVDWPALFG
ncbi:3'(2'),5'-bisphosphate nucleotidase CysQ [Oceanimonas sp. MB9]|uniref:3'(2'),5'-bisphosphate nucleotidase CysQ n=1 Tax=Oceanimonas sp. MB9 TaxID=2588453 RepID=UPI0013F602AE|nr:3'(2'),5'-bisphosphate nucleotidase CysQ [Oceanimonas sp. MB9]NHH99932.1 3'(2'),5'-bisphosphate nucleotidase CysQ [Oceanimonas sp. MB9]